MSLPILKPHCVNGGAFFICFFGLEFANPQLMIFLRNLCTVFLIAFCTQSVYAQLGPQLLSNEEPIFSHQYTLIGDHQYHFIDTSFNSLHWYHQWNARGRDNFGKTVLGSMGNPINALSFTESDGIWDYYSLGGYQSYFQNAKHIPYYYGRSPITEANYWMGYDRGQNFNIYHTQNINKDWSFLINYNRLNDLGFYAHNRNIKSKFLANTSYQNKKVGYQAKAYYLSEKMLTEENGGMANDSSLEESGARVLLDVNLLNDDRTLSRQEFFVDQNYDLTKLMEWVSRDSTVDDSIKESVESKSRIAIGHSFKYSRYTNVYEGATDEGFYTNYFFDQDGEYLDTSGYKSYANTLYILTEVGGKNRFDLKAGIKNLVTEYGGQSYRYTQSNWGLTSAIGGRISDRINVSGSFDYILAGNLRESFDINAKADLKLFDWLRAFGGYQLSSKFPELFESVYISNNHIWENNFKKEVVNKVNYGLGWGKGNHLSFTNFIANDYVYFDENVQPVQSSTAVNVFRAELVQNFRIWNFLHQDNQVYYQTVGGNASALPLPEIVSRNSLYFEFDLFKKVLKCLVGAEMNYFSSYYSPSYDPATARFYNAREREIGNYPLIDVFANFELRNARIFVKYEHLNEGLSGYNYFAAPNFALPDRVLRIGVTWRFFN